MKLLAVILLMSAAILPCFHRQRVISIPEVKAMLKGGSGSREQEYTVKGYFYVTNLPLLMTQRGWLRKNAWPDSVCIILAGQWINQNKDRLNEYQDKLLVIKGKLNMARDRTYGDIIPDFIMTAVPYEER